MAVILIRFLLTELKQISYSVIDYFTAWDNYIDIVFIISMGGYIAINMAF